MFNRESGATKGRIKVFCQSTEARGLGTCLVFILLSCTVASMLLVEMKPTIRNPTLELWLSGVTCLFPLGS